MTYQVLFSKAAAENLEQLFDFALHRELDSTTGGLKIAEKAVRAIKNGIAFLTPSAFACRKVGASACVDELITPFVHIGYVALFEVVDNSTVIIGGIRHQREADYH